MMAMKAMKAPEAGDSYPLESTETLSLIRVKQKFKISTPSTYDGSK
jgi:hypothetical protein